MSVNLGTAYAAFKIDATGFKTGISESEKSLTAFYSQTALASKSLTSFGDAATKVGKGMSVGLTAPIMAASALAVKLSNSFETSMAKVATIADTTKVPLKNLQNGLIEMSNKVGMSSDSLSDAMYQAISASVKTEDALGFVGNAAKLAKAGFTQTATSVDLLTTIMNSYGMSADKVTHISDVLVTTQNLGKTTVDELAHSMGMVIPTAKASGVSLENLSAGYEILTAKGINTAESTTYLKSMFAELGKEGTGVDKVLRGETGMGFTDLMGKGKSLGDVLAILNDYANKNGTSIKNLFGSIEAGGAAFTLADSGATDFNAKLSDLVTTTGDVDSAFKIMEKTTEEKWNKTLERGKNLLIQYGDALKKSLVPMLEKAENVAQNLYTWFTGLSNQQQQLLIKVLAVTAAVGPALIVVGKISKAISDTLDLYSDVGKAITGVIAKIAAKAAANTAEAAATATQTAATGASTAATIAQTIATKAAAAAQAIFNAVMAANPIALVVLAIAALVAGFVLLYNKCEWFRDGVNAVWGAIKDAFFVTFDAIGAFFTSTLPNVFGAVINFMQSNWQALLLFIANPFLGAFALLYNNFDGFRQVVNTLVEDIGAFFAGLWSGAVSTFSAVWDVISGFFAGLWNGITSILSTVWAAISGFFAGLWSGAVSALGGLLGLVGVNLNSILSNVTNFVLGVVSWIANIPARILGFFLSIPEQLAKIDLGKAGRDIINSLWNGLKSAWDTVAGWFSGIVDTIGGFFKGIGDAVGHVVKSVKGSHAGGLSYVPYNGYVAELHEGEKVLTRNQAEQYDKGGTGSGYTFIFNSPKELDPYEADKVMKKTYKEMEAGLI